MRNDGPASVVETDVDATWYLEAYPDVAAAGMEPAEHFRRHGRAEGRQPRYVRALELEQRLWAGFSRPALAELDAIATDATAHPSERFSAAWALARWHESHGNIAGAARYLTRLEQAPPSFLTHPGPVLLRAELLSHAGLTREAAALLDAEMASRGELADLLLARANVCNAEDERLQWMNRCYASAHLAMLRKVDDGLPLSMDNISADAAPAAANGPKVTVIMPSYNAQSHIATALRSLLTQSWRNLEVIVVDDCSTDGTLAVAKEFAGADSRVRVLKQEFNSGAYAARNAGLLLATGEFVTTQDSDDWAHPQKLELLMAPLLRDEECVAALASWARTSSRLHFRRWRVDRALVNPSVSTALYRRDVLRAIGGWDEVRIEADSEFYRRTVAAFGAQSLAQVCPEAPLVLARQGPRSLTANAETHLRTQFFGMRHQYRQLFAAWHRQARPGNLTLRSGAPRPFPAPAGMLRQTFAPVKLDLLFMADCSTQRHGRGLADLIAARSNLGLKIGLFHWPDYRAAQMQPIADALLDLALDGTVQVVGPDDVVAAKSLVVMDDPILRFPLDRVPKTHFERCVTLHGPDVAALLEKVFADASLSQPAFQPNEEHRALVESSGIFDREWYVAVHPDLHRSSIDPLTHYLAAGAGEGREPSIYFDAKGYAQRFPAAGAGQLPPALYHLTYGRSLGWDGAHPVLEGVAWRSGASTMLLCGHSAGSQLFGAERCLLEVAKALYDNGFNVIVTVPNRVNAAYIAALQSVATEVHTLRCPHWTAQQSPSSEVIRYLAALIERHSVRAVHANTIMLREPLIAARQAGVAAVVHVHEAPQKDGDICRLVGLGADEIIRQVLSHADHVIANSVFTSRTFLKAGATHVVANAVDLDALDIPNTIAKDHFAFGLISSNLPKKGLLALAEVAQMVYESTPQARFVVVGPETDALRALRDDLSAGKRRGRLSFYGYAASSREAIAQCNVVLNLSSFAESFGRTVLEAMAAGRPVIAYDWGALPELVEDAQTGYLVRYGNTAEVADRVRALCSDAGLATRLGEAGRAKAKAHFVQESINRQVADAYRVILGQSAITS
jgi:glycosyltransferase involved in cell wall biosynthesis